MEHNKRESRVRMRLRRQKENGRSRCSSFPLALLLLMVVMLFSAFQIEALTSRSGSLIHLKTELDALSERSRRSPFDRYSTIREMEAIRAGYDHERHEEMAVRDTKGSNDWLHEHRFVEAADPEPTISPSSCEKRSIADMHINENGLMIVKHFENWFNHCYICPAGKWTIGWG